MTVALNGISWRSFIYLEYAAIDTLVIITDEDLLTIGVVNFVALENTVAYGNSRKEAIRRMKRAIKEYRITGVKNTLLFGSFVMDHPEFIKGNFTTHFVDEHFTPQVQSLKDQANHQNEPWLEDLGKLGATLIGKSSTKPVQHVSVAQGSSNWSSHRRR